MRKFIYVKKEPFFQTERQRGQTLLIVILVMVVTLTVGLALVTRSLTNERIAKEEESSQRAFSAAEAGIEQVLKTGQSIVAQQNIDTQTQIKKATVTNVGNATQFLLNNGNPVPKDDGVDVWLSDYPTYANQLPTTGSMTLTVYWGSGTDTCTTNQSTNTQAAIELVLLRGTTGAAVADHYAFDPCAARQNGNKLNDTITTGSFTIAGKTFPNSAVITINATSKGLLARIVPLYASTPLAVRGSIALPAQGTVIESVGTSGGTERKITVYRGFPKTPTEFFPYMLLSP